MALEDPVIITCSISGSLANREQCPAIPYSPAEYAAEARRAVDEGASQIHIHARTPDGTMARSNGDLIAKARRLTEDVGRRPASVAQAREMLRVPRRAAA